MSNFKLKLRHYNLWKQTGLALIPLFLAVIAYPVLPAKIFVPTSVSGLSQWGIRSNIFVYPLFCLALWLMAWAFIFFNRLYEKNLTVNHQAYKPLENYYIWGSWVLDALAAFMVLLQIFVSILH
ncbi:hypothetical protein [Lactiplantibacillus daowaiensis]|uniref:Integral membrane protein n=1 Tax=Lactiplantibacillus daowaiensis TaxID=2559918 RepID=A0ABW1S033_9LACO|nr:hypothetical protein [Lactiplantibacillus daowaiensis]